MSDDVPSAPVTKSPDETDRPAPSVKHHERLRDAFPGSMEDGVLHPGEMFWTKLQPWLADQGYVIRARFRPGWKASWLGTKTWWYDCEDGQVSINGHLMDAVRDSDKRHVILKRSRPSSHPQEVEIGRFLSSGGLLDARENHSVPIYDVLQPPGEEDLNLIVMPLLRPFNDPPFETIGETVDFFAQIFEGLRFMHDHHVAHRDTNGNNIMMDATPMYPEMYHPIRTELKSDFSGPASHFSRTERPPRYYIVDFGISSKYTADQLPVQEDIIRGGDKSPPEHQDDGRETADPFPTDVYYVGNMIRTHFIEDRRGFDFMRPLVQDMVQTLPEHRPTMQQVVERFSKIRTSLSSWKLRSRVSLVDEFFVAALWRSIPHWHQQIKYIRSGLPAIPNANTTS